MTVNKLILGDNLEILKAMEAESVDLIYLDPPFFSNRAGFNRQVQHPRIWQKPQQGFCNPNTSSALN
jgi:DNA modification methylase